VRRAARPASDAPSDPPPPAAAPPAPAPAPEDAEEDGDEEDGARGDAAKQRPSYKAWHNAPQAQRFGQFSADEKRALDDAIKEYAAENALDPNSLEWLYATRAQPGSRQRAAWLALAAALPHRSARQVWGHATRRLHAGNYGGAWSEDETAQLRSLVAAHGHNWVAIGAQLERIPDACRDRCALRSALATRTSQARIAL
jgi:hypothetical protein